MSNVKERLAKRDVSDGKGATLEREVIDYINRIYQSHRS
jgi:hypothetical protein